MEDFKVIETMAGFDREVAKDLVKAAMDKIKEKNIKDPKKQQELKQQAIANSLSAVFIRAEDEEGPIMYAYEYDPENETREEFVARMNENFKNMAIKNASIKKLDINSEELQDALAEYDEAIAAEDMAEEEISFDNMVLGEADDDFDQDVEDTNDYEDAVEEEPAEYTDEEIDQQVDEELKAEKKDYTLAKVIGGVVAAGALTAIALNACGKKEEAPKEEVAIEQEAEEEQAINAVQNEFFDAIEEGLVADAEIMEEYRLDEDEWKETITDEVIEQMDEMGLKLDMSTPWAFLNNTAEERLALNIVYGDKTDEEIAQILGGNLINQAEVMENSNAALEQMSLNLFFRTSDNLVDNINIRNSFPGLSDENYADWMKFQDMLSEFAKLDAEEGKEEEAKQAYVDLVNEFCEYGINTNVDDTDFKFFILKSFGPALQIIGNEHQYTEEFTYTVFDRETGKDNVEVTDPNAPILREDMARNLWLGWEDCEVEGIDGPAITLTIRGISDRYAIPMDVEKSVVDQFYGGFAERVESYNTWMEQIRTENHVGDQELLADYMTAHPEDTITYVNEKAFAEDTRWVSLINDNSEYDTLMAGTFSYESRIASINETLEMGKNNKTNMDYYRWLASQYYLNYLNERIYSNRGPGNGDNTNTSDNTNITDLVENSTDPEILQKAEEARKAFIDLYLQTTGRELINPEDEAAYIQQHVEETRQEVQQRVDAYNANHGPNDQMRVEAVGTQQQMQNAGISIDTSRLGDDGDSYTEQVGPVQHSITYVDANGNTTQGATFTSNSEQLTDAQRQEAINHAPITYDDAFKDAVIEDHNVSPQSSTTSSSSSSTTTTEYHETSGDTGLYDETVDYSNTGTTVVNQEININVNTGDSSNQDSTVVETSSSSEESYSDGSSSEEYYSGSSSSEESYSEPETVYTESEGDTGEYTSEDPTTSDTFAPVVESEDVYGSIMEELDSMEPEDSLESGRSR